MPREIEQREFDCLRREITIVCSRLARLISDLSHLEAALHPFEDYDTVSRNKGEVGSGAVRQPSLEFGSGSVGDFD